MNQEKTTSVVEIQRQRDLSPTRKTSPPKQSSFAPRMQELWQIREDEMSKLKKDRLDAGHKVLAYHTTEQNARSVKYQEEGAKLTQTYNEAVKTLKMQADEKEILFNKLFINTVADLETNHTELRKAVEAKYAVKVAECLKEFTPQ